MKLLKNSRPTLTKLPTSNGVYFFRDQKGKILYIGKAANLKSRLASYFLKPRGPVKRQSRHGTLRGNQTKEPRILKMLEEAKKLDWQETGSEVEALILESQLIKKHRPKFNILMRDDKQYFYVVFTKENFPKIFTTHQPNKPNRGALYYRAPLLGIVGPFTDGGALKTTLKLLRRIFPYCTCKQKHYNYCLNYHLGNCPGYCCLKIKNQSAKIKITTQNLKIYKKNTRAVKEILSGKKSRTTKNLKREMLACAKKDDFQNAIKIRKQLASLKKVFENARIIQKQELGTWNLEFGTRSADFKKMLGLKKTPQRIEGYDISNIQGRFATGSMVVFAPVPSASGGATGQVNFQPDKSQYRKFKIKAAGKPDDIKMLKEVLNRRLKHEEWQYPDLIIIDGGKGQLNAALEARNQKPETGEIPIAALTKNQRHKADHIFYTVVEKSRMSGKTQKVKIATMPLGKLPKKVRNLILHIDGEAHRFAISYYRKLHRKTTKTG